MSRVLSLALAVLVVIPAWDRLAAQDSFPPRPPKPTRLTPSRFPPYEEMTLPNGLAIVVVPLHGAPLAAVSLSFRAGSVYDPAGKEGLAELAAQVLTKGTSTRTADEIAMTIEGSGGRISASSSDDFLTVAVEALSDQLEVGFTVLGDVIQHASFPGNELDLARKRQLSTLRVAMSEPVSVSLRFFRREIFGASSYGRYATEESYGAITRDDLVAFAQTRLRPGGALLVVAGDVTLPQVQALVQQAFAGWTGAAPTSRPPASPVAPHKPEIILIHRPSSVQSFIIMGNTTIAPTDPVYYAARVATHLLGGGADSRLFRVLREQKSWTYSTSTELRRYRVLGYWSASASMRTEATDSALNEMVHQVERMRTEIVPDSELATTKGFLVGSFPLSIETAGQVANQVGATKFLGLDADYLRLYRERVSAVTATETRAAAARLYRTDAWTIVVAGDGAKLYSKLVAIAPVRILDTDGNPLTTDAFAPAAVAPTLDAAGLAVGRDSFVATSGGNAIGSRVVTVRHSGDSLIFSDTMTLRQSTTREVVAVLDAATLAPRSVDQTGTSAGQRLEVHLTYQGGRVRGIGTVPGPNGPAPVKVDTTIAAGTYDGHALAPLISAIKLAAGQPVALPVFSIQTGTVRTITVAADSVRSVTVPAGTFKVFRVRGMGGDANLVWYVTSDSPHRIVRTELVGTPVVFELVK
ncbi:MAG TPA: pitrilysin family protein [Gemmatimonadales bacterium]|nr:pitrilysin family protein [Gemmatimonadales bacterium]